MHAEEFGSLAPGLFGFVLKVILVLQGFLNVQRTHTAAPVLHVHHHEHGVHTAVNVTATASGTATGKSRLQS